MPVRESNVIASRLDESNGGNEFYELDTELFECPSCSAPVDVSSYFHHVNDVHELFPCLYCLQNFKMSKELMLHLTHEHLIEAQKFSNCNDFLDKGGMDTALACVECNKIFESDTFPSITKTHSQECRISTGVCPKCGTIHSLKSLGEHIVHCGAAVTTSSLRNRDNSCKYCGQKFSISTIAAHVRACPNQSTKSTYNVWNGNSISKSPLQMDNQVAAPKAGRLSTSPESKRISNKLLDGLREAPRRNGLPELPKLQPAPRVRMKSKYTDDEPLPNLSPKENLSFGDTELVPLNSKGSATARLSPTKDSRKKLNGSSNAVFKHKQKTKSSRRKKDEKYASPVVEDSYNRPSSPPTEDMQVEQPEDSPPTPPVYVDPLIREQDDDKRLSLLIQELADKIVENCLRNDIPDVVQSAEPPSECKNAMKRYEVVLDDSPSKKSDSWILNEMIVKSSLDCSYCKLVRLIRVDKRQLVIHLLTKHLWDLSVFPGTPPTVKSDSKIIDSVVTPSEEHDNAVKTEPSEIEPLAINITSNKSVSLPEVTFEKDAVIQNELLSTQSSKEECAIEEVEGAESKAIVLKSSMQSLTVIHPISDEMKEVEPKAAGLESTADETLQPVSQSLQECESKLEAVPVPETPLHHTNHNLKSDCKSDIEEKNNITGNIASPSSKNVEEEQLLQAESVSCAVSEPSNELKVNAQSAISIPSDHNVPTVPNATPGEDVGETDSMEVANPMEQPMKDNLKQECPLAEDAVANTDSLKDQIRLKLSWPAFKLALLQKVFRSAEVVFACMDVVAGKFGERPCHCLICGQASESQKGLFPHWKRIHRGAVMRCTLCKGKFLFAGALYSHLCVGTPQPLTLFPIEREDEEGVGDHTVGLRYQCGLCDDVLLPGFFNLMVHLRKDHNQCELCLESLETQKDLEHHVKKHKLNHFCWKCSVSYCAKPNFMTHLFWKHGTESVDCSKCLKKKWPHIYHFCIPPEYFVCDVCGLYFTRPMALIVHKRFHTGEKLKRCPKISCGEKFVSKKLLQKHIETVHPKPQPNNLVLPIEAPIVAADANTIESQASETSVAPPPPVESGVSTDDIKPEIKIDDVEPVVLKDQASCPEEAEVGEKHGTSESEIPTHNSAEPAEDEKIATTLVPGPLDEEATTDAGTEDDRVIKDPVDLSDEVINNEKAPTMEVDEAKEKDSSSEVADEFCLQTADMSDPRPPLLEKSPVPDVKPAKRFNLAEIQGPNLSEDESESDADEVQRSSPTGRSDHVVNFTTDKSCISPTIQPIDNELNFRGLSPLSSTLSTSMEAAVKNGIIRSIPSSLNLSEDDEDDDDKMDTGNDTNDLINPISIMDMDEEAACKDDRLSHAPESRNEDMDMLDGCVDKMKHIDDFGSMSPLLPPLDDFNFNVPEIPTFEENRLPEHIIQENALFSIQHEHDYSVLSTNIFGIKRKPLSPAYNSSNLYHSSSRSPSETRRSPSRGKPKKTKSSKSPSKSPKKRRRSRSSSSSSSSSSSCSSCGSDCSCSSRSSGSSSSSSSDSDSSESEDERRLTPVKSKKYSKSPSHSSPRSKHSPKKKIAHNGKLPKVKSPKKAKRGRGRPPKVKIAPEVPVHEPEPEPEKEPEPMILESDLETDDSGSEEIFHKQQMTEVVGAVKPACDEVWDMKSEKFLLRLVRGVNNLDELQSTPELEEPPPPPAFKKEKVKYSVKGSNNPQPKLKVRNIPIKPLIVKRNVPVGNDPVDKFNSGMSPTFHLPNGDSPKSSKGKKRSLKSTFKLNKTVKTLSDGSAFIRYQGSSPAESVDGFSSGTESVSKKKRKSKKSLDNFHGLPLPPTPEAYVDEKLYCVCQCPHDNVSQMIGCDGKDCQYKWFHFECVGICIPPKGKWFCSECREKRRRKAAAKLQEQEED